MVKETYYTTVAHAKQRIEQMDMELDAALKRIAELESRPDWEPTVHDRDETINELEDRIAELEGALLKLANEVGALRFKETAVRETIGNTNWSVLMERESEARAKLGTGGGE